MTTSESTDPNDRQPFTEMVTVRWPAGEPSIDELAEHFGLTANAFDRGFGIFPPLPGDGGRSDEYLVLVTTDAAQAMVKASSSEHPVVRFARPEIDPFGQ